MIKFETSTLISLFFISACASTPSFNDTAVQSTEETKSQQAAQANGEKYRNSAPATTTTLQEQKSSSASVYFEKDQFNITVQYQPVLNLQADLLKQNGKSVILEGNADERGSSEFNLALGDKRAHAVRKSLQILGVPADHTSVISYGEERPRLTCHEEKCWHENRRVDLKY